MLKFTYIKRKLKSKVLRDVPSYISDGKNSKA